MKSLVIHYGNPTKTPQADVTVLGPVQWPGHWAYESGKEIIKSRREVYVYIPLGFEKKAFDWRGGYTAGLTEGQLRQEVIWARDIGAGVFVDTAGNDYGVNNGRRSYMRDLLFAHHRRAIWNAWDSRDVWAVLSARDAYLFESFQGDVKDPERLEVWAGFEWADRPAAYAVTTAPVNAGWFRSGEKKARKVAEKYGIAAFQYGLNDGYGV